MTYCSKCGKPLAGARNFCSNCGYKAETVKSRDDSREIITAEIADDNVMDSADGETKSGGRPPVDRSCIECDEDANQKCYFCWSNICTNHTKHMQIFINKAPFGNQVVSCRRCSDEKQGQQPTQSEAEGASLFFGVKPYHEWKLVK